MNLRPNPTKQRFNAKTLIKPSSCTLLLKQILLNPIIPSTRKLKFEGLNRRL